ncbi:hypothetical protein HET73_04795 [Wolbachia endosymbiont of Atemnus politus]|nr:hypothetical protein [Wolbachia endosymbiont of Atemnus politus]
MNNIKKNKEKEEGRKRLAKALKQNIVKRKKQQQSRQDARAPRSGSNL